MEWREDSGVWTATSRGIVYRLLPCAEALFDLAAVQLTCAHLDRLQAHGQGWANGCQTAIAYRKSDAPPVGKIKSREVAK